jgi:hypothetical protein
LAEATPWPSPSNATSALVFCPVCKAEYRSGFTKCSDCGVVLVENLTRDSGAHTDPIGDPDAMEVLWAGLEARIASSIRSALDREKIAYREDSVESQFMPAFRQSIHRIEVRKADYQAARKCLEGLAGTDPIDPKSPGALLDRNSSVLSFLGISRSPFDGRPVAEPFPPGTAPNEIDSAPVPENDSEEANVSGGAGGDDLVENFYPEDAICEVWCGEDPETAENIRMCLREVGIGCDLRQENGQSQVLVMPPAEPRAKEIIREMIEATPPE